jgi:hypothetical protein
MDKKFAYIDCYKNIKEIPMFMPFYKFYSEKSIKKKLLKKFPHTMEEVEYIGETGLKIVLPIITSINETEDEEYIKKVIEIFNSMVLRYNVNVLILCDRLYKYKQYFEITVVKERYLGILYINEILDISNKLINKDIRDIKYVIIDGDNSIGTYIVDNIYQNINSLIIVTDNPSKYEHTIEEIYEDTGLAVQVYTKNINQEISGDIIINCNSEKDKIYFCWQKKAILIDFVSTMMKLKDIMAKRKDLTLVYDIKTKVDKNIVNNNILLGILLNKNRLLRSVYVYSYRKEMKDRIPVLKDSNGYNIEFEVIKA